MVEAQDMAHVKADATGARQALHEQLTALTEQQAALAAICAGGSKEPVAD